MYQVLYTETLNRAILTGVMIVGFAVVMISSAVLPAMAVEKVTICHVMNNGNTVTKDVPVHKVASHLAHGDTLGPCPSPMATSITLDLTVECDEVKPGATGELNIGHLTVDGFLDFDGPIAVCDSPDVVVVEGLVITFDPIVLAEELVFQFICENDADSEPKTVFVPIGFSQSTNEEGLSFAMGTCNRPGQGNATFHAEGTVALVPTFDVIVLQIGVEFFPKVQFFSGEHGDCDPLHYHTVADEAVSIELAVLAEPVNPCGYGLASVIKTLVVQMTQAEIDAWNAANPFTIPP